MRVRFMPGLAALSVCAIGAAHAAADAEIPAGRPDMITPEAESAIRRGFEYLARIQGRDGAWRVDEKEAAGGEANADTGGRYACVMTSMAGLALLAGGSTPYQGPCARNVRRAVDFLMLCAHENGAISDPRGEARSMYGHGFAMLFLSQVYGMEQDADRQRALAGTLKRAAEFSGRCQAGDGGWGYGFHAGPFGEGSVTVTQIQGLRAVRDAGVPVSGEIIARAVRLIESLQNPDGGIRYSTNVQENGRDSRPAISAAAMVTLYSAARFDQPAAVRAREFVRRTMVDAETGKLNEQMQPYYTLFYAAQGFHFSGEEDWKRFFPAQRDDLVTKQDRATGAWPEWSGGRIFSTAVALIVLQLPYGYVPVFQR